MRLIAHLGGHLVLLGRLGHQPGLPNRVRQRLLAIDVLAHPHGPHRRVAVSMIGRGNRHRVEAFFLVQHDAEIAIYLGVRIDDRGIVLPLPSASVIHVAKRRNRPSGGIHTADLTPTLAPDPDTAHVDPIVGPEHTPRNERGSNRHRTGCLEKRSSGRSGSSHLLVLLQVFSGRPEATPQKCNQTDASKPTVRHFERNHRQSQSDGGQLHGAYAVKKTADTAGKPARQLLYSSTGRSSAHLGFFFLYC